MARESGGVRGIRRADRADVPGRGQALRRGQRAVRPDWRDCFTSPRRMGIITLPRTPFLARVSEIFGLDERGSAASAHVGSRMRRPTPWTVLGVAPDAPLEEARRRPGRPRCARPIPDRMLARGVPEEAVKLAERRLTAGQPGRGRRSRPGRRESACRAWRGRAASGSRPTTWSGSTRSSMMMTGFWTTTAGPAPAERDAGKQIAALTTVFRSLDADAVMVVEAPDNLAAAQRGRWHWRISRRPAGIRAREVCFGFANRHAAGVDA